MLTRGIRGAITVDNNNKESMKEAVIELLGAILKQNDVKLDDVAFAIFTVTPDIDADFPAKYAREYCGFEYIPMMCYREMEVKGAINLCLRVLLSVNTEKGQKEIKHQYLKGAEKLRPDIRKTPEL